MNPQNTKLTNEKIDEILQKAIDLGQRLESKKGLTTNQGGIPHPELFEKNMVKLYTKNLQSLIHQAEIKARIDEVELAWHNNRIVLFDYQNRLSELWALEKEIVNE